MRGLLFLFLLWLAPGLWAQEHQRIGVPDKLVHRWDGGAEVALTPFGIGQWHLEVSPSGSYEFQDSWSVSWTQPYAWTSDPVAQTTKGTWLDGLVSLGWRGRSGDLRWRTSWAASLPGAPMFGEGIRQFSSEAAVQVVQDPVILGVSLGISVPTDAKSLSGQGNLVFQEVVNDKLTWSLILSPHWFLYDRALFVALSFAWRVGWYDGPYSGSTGFSSGSGRPWMWSVSGTRSWEFR